MTYPEHEKLRKVSGNSQAIGEFYDWLEGHGVHLATYSTLSGDDRLVMARTNIQDLLAEFYDIDRVALEEEKRAMLRTIREAAS